MSYWTAQREGRLCITQYFKCYFGGKRRIQNISTYTLQSGSNPQISNKSHPLHNWSLSPFTHLELMPKAVMKASLIWYIKAKGLLLRTTRKISGRMMNAWIIKPTITVTMNNASLPSSSPISSMLATRCAIRLQIPTGAYLQKTTEKKLRHESINTLCMFLSTACNS